MGANQSTIDEDSQSFEASDAPDPPAQEDEFTVENVYDRAEKVHQHVVGIVSGTPQYRLTNVECGPGHVNVEVYHDDPIIPGWNLVYRNRPIDSLMTIIHGARTMVSPTIPDHFERTLYKDGRPSEIARQLFRDRQREMEDRAAFARKEAAEKQDRFLAPESWRQKVAEAVAFTPAGQKRYEREHQRWLENYNPKRLYRRPDQLRMDWKTKQNRANAAVYRKSQRDATIKTENAQVFAEINAQKAKRQSIRW